MHLKAASMPHLIISSIASCITSVGLRVSVSGCLGIHRAHHFCSQGSPEVQVTRASIKSLRSSYMGLYPHRLRLQAVSPTLSSHLLPPASPAEDSGSRVQGCRCEGCGMQGFGPRRCSTSSSRPATLASAAECSVFGIWGLGGGA